jgi:hypothetical protein
MAPGARRLVVVSAEHVRTHSAAGTLPVYVTVSPDVLYEVAAEVGADGKIAMSRVFFEECVRVVDS